MPDSTAPVRTRWGAVALILAAGVVGAFQIGKVPVALPGLRADLGLDLVAGGWVISAITAVGVFTGMGWGYVSDRVGALRIVLGGLALVALGSLLGAWTQGPAGLLATRIVEGAGYIAVITAGPSLIMAATAPADRSIAFGVWSFYLPFGLSGMVVLSPLMLTYFDWRGVWTINAALALATLVALAALVREPALTEPGERPAPPSLDGVWQTLTAPGPHVLALCFAAYSLIHLSVVAFLPTFLIERRGIAPDEAALMTAFAMFMNAPGCLLGGWLLRLRVPAWALIAGGYLGMLVAAFGVFSEDLPGGLRYALAVALPFSGGVIPPAVLDRVPRHAASPALAATTVGLIIQMISLAQFVGPPLLAWLVAGAASWQSATRLTVTAAVVGLVAAAALRSLERRQ